MLHLQLIHERVCWGSYHYCCGLCNHCNRSLSRTTMQSYQPSNTTRMHLTPLWPYDLDLTSFLTDGWTPYLGQPSRQTNTKNQSHQASYTHTIRFTCMPVYRWHFEMNFLEWKCMNVDWNFIVLCSLEPNQQYSSIGSDNGLASTRWQAIIWTNAGILLLNWRIYASLSLNELTSEKPEDLERPCQVW